MMTITVGPHNIIRAATALNSFLGPKLKSPETQVSTFRVALGVFDLEVGAFVQTIEKEERCSLINRGVEALEGLIIVHAIDLHGKRLVIPHHVLGKTISIIGEICIIPFDDTLSWIYDMKQP